MFKKFLVGTFAVLALVVGLALASNVTEAAYDFGTTTLKVGSTGEAVKNVQMVVGATPVDGVFGPITKAKVMAWQANNGLVADGLFGNMSKAKANGGSAMSSGSYPAGCTSSVGYSPTTGVKCDSAMSSSLPAGCTSTAGYSVTTGAKCDSSVSSPSAPLAGTFGTISTMTQLSQYSNEQVGAGQTDVKVAGFEAKASNDGDIKLSSIKLTFDATGNASGDSDRIIDYLKSVKVMQGSTVIGSASTDDFSRDSTGVYSKTLELSDSVIRANQTEKFYIAVSAISNLDSGDIDSDSWTIAINNVRIEDGSGVVTTETSAIPAAMDYDAAGDGVAISFVSYSTAADTEVKFSLSSSSPAAGVSKISTTLDTNGVVLTKGKIKVEGDSDVWLDELRVIYTTNATRTQDVANTVYLTLDGQEFSKTSGGTGTTETVGFDNLDMTLSAGDTVDFTLSADINDIQTTYFDEGDYLSAAITSTERALMTIENDQGDALTDATEVTGTTIGNIQYFYSVAPTVSVESKSIVPNDNGSSAPTSATAKMRLKLTATGGTVYLYGDDETTSTLEFFQIAVDGGDSSSSISSYTFTPSGTYTVTNNGSNNEYYTLYEGDTMYVDIEAVVVEATGSSAILVGMKGSSILFDISTPDGSTLPTGSLSYSGLTDLLKTGKTTLDS